MTGLIEKIITNENSLGFTQGLLMCVDPIGAMYSYITNDPVTFGGIGVSQIIEPFDFDSKHYKISKLAGMAAGTAITYFTWPISILALGVADLIIRNQKSEIMSPSLLLNMSNGKDISKLFEGSYDIDKAEDPLYESIWMQRRGKEPYELYSSDHNKKRNFIAGFHELGSPSTYILYGITKEQKKLRILMAVENEHLLNGKELNSSFLDSFISHGSHIQNSSIPTNTLCSVYKDSLLFPKLLNYAK